MRVIRGRSFMDESAEIRVLYAALQSFSNGFQSNPSCPSIWGISLLHACSLAADSTTVTIFSTTSLMESCTALIHSWGKLPGGPALVEEPVLAGEPTCSRKMDLHSKSAGA